MNKLAHLKFNFDGCKFFNWLMNFPYESSVWAAVTMNLSLIIIDPVLLVESDVFSRSLKMRQWLKAGLNGYYNNSTERHL